MAFLDLISHKEDVILSSRGGGKKDLGDQFKIEKEISTNLIVIGDQLIEIQAGYALK